MNEIFTPGAIQLREFDTRHPAGRRCTEVDDIVDIDFIAAERQRIEAVRQTVALLQQAALD